MAGLQMGSSDPVAHKRSQVKDEQKPILVTAHPLLTIP